MRSIIFKTGFPPGDVVMLTAAVRDLHRCYPGEFRTDVRTLHPELWENNPFLTSLAEEDPEVEVIHCTYPLIDRCNWTPYHCLHGFIEFFNAQLGLNIKPTLFRGDLHLSALEKSWYSQVHEVTGEDTPFWIVSAGGKHDVSIKWWETKRYQEVVDHFRGRILFVQVGAPGHHHPRLKGVVDLRGHTNLRELVRLVYHAQGILCPVTLLMHLAAAVETKDRSMRNRPCVVVAGGREPAHWEAYPAHQFIHTTGSLSCCNGGGCWRDRVHPLRDGDDRDEAEQRCVDVVADLPRCMDMITPEDVIARIQYYLRGNLSRVLSPAEISGARRGIRRTRQNAFDRLTLTMSSAGLACDAFVQTLSPAPQRYRGRGIVICAGGAKYFPCAWVCVNMLRRLGWDDPIQIWHLGRREMSAEMRQLLRPLGVECVDAVSMRRRFPVRRLAGWPLKAFALCHAPFRETLLLDADNVPVQNPSVLFASEPYQKTGAIFWPDYGILERSAPIWRSCGLERPREPEFESGQIVVDKARCWKALRLSLWFNENADFYYRHLHGDKETFHLAFRKLGQPYALVPHPIHPLTGTMCQHDFEGKRIFQHRNLLKWQWPGPNRRVAGFEFEDECLAYLAELNRRWNGGPVPARRKTRA